MNKKFTILMLLMTLFVPWAAKAQETKTIQVTPDRGGERGTMTVYKRVSSPSSGSNYLIVNSATANSDALALSQASSTASTITASFVHINSGISATSNVAYIANVAEPTAVWRATSGWNFSHSKSGTTYYIYTSSSYSSAGSLSANTTATNWDWSNNQLSYTASFLGVLTSTYYITPSSSGFSIGSDAANVYLFEETSVTAYDVTAEVSPAGIGRVTGAGQYPAGASCTLMASTYNHEYAFSNWTVNGVVVSTNPTYTFTVNADQNVVANFESTVACPSPSNLTVGTPYAHSVPLTWSSDADNFNVRYRTIGSGETQVFFDGFENGLGNWTTIRHGGGTTSTDWSQGPDRDNLYAHTGSYVAESRSWNTTAYSVDNWLITPQVTLDGTLKFWAYGNGSYPDHYDVYVSTTGNSIADFSLFYEPASVTSTWTEVTVDLSSFNGARGYIALRHTDSDKEYLMIDDFGIYAQRYGEWSQLIPVEGTSFTLTGLESQTQYQVQVQANCGDELSNWSNRVNFTTTAPSTAAPTNLTVDINSITTNSATASWQGVAANDSHQYYQLYYAESNVNSVPSTPTAPNLIDSITETSYTLTGLQSDTDYHVWVRDYCGEDGYSNWTSYVNFTTLESCPRPTNVTASNETGHGATIAWTGYSDSYLVMVSEAEQGTTYSYDFENGTQDWTVLKGNTGDSPNNWHHSTTHVSYDGNTGNIQDWSSFGHNSSSGFMISESYISATSSGGTAYGAVTPDNYLVSPQVRLGGSISFYAGARNTSYCAEKFSVMVSTTDNTNTESFTTVETWILSLSENGFNPTPYTVDLSAYAGQTGYIAIRHWDCYDQWVLCIDDITIESGSTETSWMTYEAEESPFVLYDVVNIHPESTYNVQVIGICGDEESHPSATTSFTTIIACPAPTGLAVVENSVTGHDATITWNGTGEGYNVFLGTVGTAAELMNVNFSNGIPSNWSNSSSYPWTVTDGYIKSSNAGVASSTSSISVTVTFPADGTIEFDAECMGEGTSTYWDHCDFLIDDATQLNAGGNISGWNHYAYEVTAGQHTFTWSYTKDGSINPTGDYFAIDNVVMTSSSIVWGDPIYAESTEYTFHGLASETTYFVKVQSDCGVDGLSAESNSVTFTTEISCPAPTGLNVSDISGHGATASWNKMATQATGSVTFNYVCIASGDTLNWDNASIVVDNMDDPNPPTVNLSGLTPETEYTFYLRRDCGDDDYSAVLSTTFTTDVTCPAPSELAVVDNSITGHGATLTWTGYSNSYIVKYRMPEYIDGISEEFNTSSVPTGWTRYSGLVNNVIAGTTTLTETTSGWNTNSYALGTYNMKVNIYGTSCNYWLVTPEISVGNDFGLSFDLALTDYANSDPIEDPTAQAEDRFVVLVYTNDAWQILREWNNSGSANVYNNISSTGENVSIDLSAYQGRTVKIAFYGESTASGGDNDLHIDNVTLGALVPAGEWQTVNADSTSITLTGLAPETLYEVVVQGDCGEEGISAESEPITFTTDISCPAPTPLDATEVTSNSAVLNWTGDAESYNVSYYKTFFFENFESDEDFHSLWTVYHQGDPESWVWEIENPHDNSADLSAHSGSFAAVAYSDQNIHADNWLVSPQIQFPNQTTLKFWVSRSTYDDAQDEYEVLLSTTGNAIEDFDIVLKEKAAASSTWTEVSIDLSEYDGQLCYIAIRHDFTDGFFIMVDDFGIFGWSEEITTTDNSLLIEDLLPETEYQWKVQANCGEVDGLSQWSNIGNFTTLRACPVPFDLSATQETAYGATIAWTGFSESYNVWVGQYEVSTTNYDFEDQNISDFTTTTTEYPWTVTSNDKHSGSYSVKSGGAGVNSATSDLNLEVTIEHDATLSFWARISSESTYDKGYFSIDGVNQSGLNGISGNGSWINYTYTLEAGSHTLRWYYTKDTSVNTNDDCFYVDDITIESDVLLSEMNYTATESPFILNDESYILPETTYLVKVKGICEDEETEYSEAITFTTLDESTKIFVVEGEWSNGDNWVPAGVPTIDENVILRADATVFDVAETNSITIEGTATLTIEDGGQLKTNSDVTATMKKFVIGYGTDYVETNNGYYLMTLPTAAPVSAADAGLLTEESDYDLYSWDRTATDEEWQNSHDGIDLQNGVGFLYANRDDMEMFFTATLRNSSEPVVVTPSYDEVEHGGWNLCGNPFPCEAYITTDAEGMAFYRLADNQLELIEGAIAPLEAFFVNATAAGQTFTISREAPEESKSPTNGNTNHFKVKFVTK